MLKKKWFFSKVARNYNYAIIYNRWKDTLKILYKRPYVSRAEKPSKNPPKPPSFFFPFLSGRTRASTMAPPKSTSKRTSKNQLKVSAKPFKPKAKAKGSNNNFDDTVLSKEQSSGALQLEDDVPDFPRGAFGSRSHKLISFLNSWMGACFYKNFVKWWRLFPSSG